MSNSIYFELGEKLHALGYAVSYCDDGIIAMFKDIAIIASYTGYHDDYFAVSVDICDVSNIVNANEEKNSKARFFRDSIGRTAYDCAMKNCRKINVSRRGLLCNHDHSEFEIITAAQKMLKEEYRK